MQGGDGWHRLGEGDRCGHQGDTKPTPGPVGVIGPHTGTRVWGVWSGGRSPWYRSGAGLHVLGARSSAAVQVSRWPRPSFLQGATRCWSAWSAGPCSTASTSRAPCTASPSPPMAGKGLPAQDRRCRGLELAGADLEGFFHSGVPVGAGAVPCVGSPDSS